MCTGRRLGPPVDPVARVGPVVPGRRTTAQTPTSGWTCRLDSSHRLSNGLEAGHEGIDD